MNLSLGMAERIYGAVIKKTNGYSLLKAIKKQKAGATRPLTNKDMANLQTIPQQTKQGPTPLGWVYQFNDFIGQLSLKAARPHFSVDDWSKDGDGNYQVIFYDRFAFEPQPYVKTINRAEFLEYLERNRVNSWEVDEVVNGQHMQRAGKVDINTLVERQDFKSDLTYWLEEFINRRVN